MSKQNTDPRPEIFMALMPSPVCVHCTMTQLYRFLDARCSRAPKGDGPAMCFVHLWNAPFLLHAGAPRDPADKSIKMRKQNKKNIAS